MVRPPPRVTGLSPKEGPPGTKIIIRGEHLGNNAQDLINVVICGAECIFGAEWQNPSKIICRSGNGVGTGDVIVTTETGGNGTCTVQFRAYMDSVGLAKESAIWVDDSRFEHGGKNQLTTGLTEADNPLGLSDENNICPFAEDELIERFPDGSGDLAKENFVPAMFLLENHGSASLEDLRRGLRHMQAQNRQSNGPVLFLKAHLGSYFECIDTLDNLQARFAEDSVKFVEDVDGLIEKVTNARDATGKTYEAVFRRRQLIAFYQNAANTVQRFSYLFNILATAHRHIKNHQFHAMIEDYDKLEGVLKKSGSPILQKAFEEIENKIEDLRKILRNRLKTMPGKVNDQACFCRSLAILRDTSTASWELIINLHEYLIQKVLDVYCSVSANGRDAAERVLSCVRSKAVQKADFKMKIASPFDLKTAESSLNDPDSPAGKNAVEMRHPDQETSGGVSMCRLVKAVSDSMVEHLEHYSRINEVYHRTDTHAGLEETERKRRELALRQQPEMYKEAADIYAAIILDAFGQNDVFVKPDDFSIVIAAVHEVRLLFPAKGAEQLLFKKLILNMKRTFVFGVLKRGVEEVETIICSGRERADKTHRLASKFPEIFTTIAARVFLDTKPYIQPDTIHQISLLEESGSTDEILELWNKLLRAPMTTFRDFAQNGTSIVILFSLMSMHSMVHKILPRLFSLLKKLLPVPGKYPRLILEKYIDLVDDLRKSYIEIKSGPIMGVIEKLMADYGVDWKKTVEPVAVNLYVGRIAMDLNAAHEELTVFASEPGLVDEMMSEIVEKVTEELNRLFVVTSSFSVCGALQGHLDMLAYKLVIGRFQNDASKKLLAEIDALLKPGLQQKNPSVVNPHLEKFKRRHQMLIFSEKNRSDPVRGRDLPFVNQGLAADVVGYLYQCSTPRLSGEDMKPARVLYRPGNCDKRVAYNVTTFLMDRQFQGKRKRERQRSKSSDSDSSAISAIYSPAKSVSRRQTIDETDSSDDEVDANITSQSRREESEDAKEFRPFDAADGWRVDSIHAKRSSHLPTTAGESQREYFVRWKGQELDDGAWIPAEYLSPATIAARVSDDLLELSSSSGNESSDIEPDEKSDDEEKDGSESDDNSTSVEELSEEDESETVKTASASDSFVDDDETGEDDDDTESDSGSSDKTSTEVESDSDSSGSGGHLANKVRSKVLASQFFLK